MEVNGYQLSRYFWDYAFENTGKIKPIHVSIYFFAMEHCNRLGWKKQFGLPTSMVLEAISVKSYSVYKSAFDDLVEFGLIEVIQYSKNQYSSNIIALKENNKANTKATKKALDKALIDHTTKQCSSTVESMVSIDKQTNKLTSKPTNKEPTNNIGADKSATPEERALDFRNKVAEHLNEYSKEMLRSFYDYWTEMNEGGRKMRFETHKIFNIKKRLTTWKNNESKFGKKGSNGFTTKREQNASELKQALANSIMQEFGNGQVQGGG